MSIVIIATDAPHQAEGIARKEPNNINHDHSRDKHGQKWLNTSDITTNCLFQRSASPR